MTDLTRLSAAAMAGILRSGEVSARELAVAHLDAAEAGNHALNAWLAIDRDGALRQADAADARLRERARDGSAPTTGDHPLLGIPVALKDLISVEGGQCTAGSRILEGYVAPYDAHITERLRAVGAVILGKTNMDEFAMGSSNEHSAFGPVSNPWDLDTVPGGSSGGSAVAVAAYHAPLSIGTDTGGSIRQPASLTGIVGLKPTYGRVSRYGIVAFASSLDQIGPFARDAGDAAALLHAIAGRDERDSTSAPAPVPDELLRLPKGDEAAAGLRGKRLGLPREYFVAGMEPDARRR
ncbi:MAG TPA: amidase, partial [Candidatus Limnocylindrales bacterium]|nr:amidase [Candidatus Limnocylindrales bacterium]